MCDLAIVLELGFLNNGETIELEMIKNKLNNRLYKIRHHCLSVGIAA